MNITNPPANNNPAHCNINHQNQPIDWRCSSLRRIEMMITLRGCIWSRDRDARFSMMISMMIWLIMIRGPCFWISLLVILIVRMMLGWKGWLVISRIRRPIRRSISSFRKNKNKWKCKPKSTPKYHKHKKWVGKSKNSKSPKKWVGKSKNNKNPRKWVGRSKNNKKLKK